jgi:hypothetical protein
MSASSGGTPFGLCAVYAAPPLVRQTIAERRQDSFCRNHKMVQKASATEKEDGGIKPPLHKKEPG